MERRDPVNGHEVHVDALEFEEKGLKAALAIVREATPGLESTKASGQGSWDP